MQTHNSRLYRLEGLNIHALRQIEYSTNNLRGINNYKPLKLVLETMPVYLYIYGYS
jgi:hypothetical protein